MKDIYALDINMDPYYITPCERTWFKTSLDDMKIKVVEFATATNDGTIVSGWRAEGEF